MIYASNWVRVPVGTRVRDSKLDIYVINMGCVVGGERGRLSWEREDEETGVTHVMSSRFSWVNRLRLELQRSLQTD